MTKDSSWTSIKHPASKFIHVMNPRKVVVIRNVRRKEVQRNVLVRRDSNWTRTGRRAPKVRASNIKDKKKNSDNLNRTNVAQILESKIYLIQFEQGKPYHTILEIVSLQR